MCSCLRPKGGDDCKIIAAVSANMGRWLQDNKGNTPLLRSWGPIFGPRAPTYIGTLHKAIEYAAELPLCPRPLGETAVRTMRPSPSRPGGEGCHEGIGDRHMDPDYPCLSANQREFLPSCPCWTTMGEYSQANVLSEHWPGNSAIRCRVRGLGHSPDT